MTAQKSFVLKTSGTDRYQVVDPDDEPIAEVDRFLRAIELRGLSRWTRRAYAFDLLAFYRWLADTGRALETLESPDLLELIAAQRAAGFAPTTINRRLVTVRLFHCFCTGRDLERSTTAGLSPAPYYRGRGKDRDLGLHALSRPRRIRLRVKTPRRIVEPLTIEEVRAFLRRLKRYRDLAIVYLMLLCGLRSQEITHLDLDDASLDERRVRVRGKGNKDRVLPLPDLVLRCLVDYLRWERPQRCATSRLFVVLQGKRRGQPMTTVGLRSLFRHRRQRREVARANPHRFRHTFGADMARAGVRLPILQRMMGHEHGTTTLQYIHLSMADIAAEYQRAIQEIAKRYPG